MVTARRGPPRQVFLGDGEERSEERDKKEVTFKIRCRDVIEKRMKGTFEGIALPCANCVLPLLSRMNYNGSTLVPFPGAPWLGLLSVER
jgi:hypothetical protein